MPIILKQYVHHYIFQLKRTQPTDCYMKDVCSLIFTFINGKIKYWFVFAFFFSLFHWIKFINLRKFRNQIFMNLNLRHAPAEVHFSVNSMSRRCELWNSVFTKYLIKNTNQHTHKHILGDRIFLNCSAWKTLVIFFSRYVVLLYRNSLTLFKKKNMSWSYEDSVRHFRSNLNL